MAEKRRYAKGIAKRAEILDAALRVIGRDGYTGATVKQLADEVGLSQNGLLHYFGSKDALFVEVVRYQDRFVGEQIDADNVDFSQDFARRVLDAAEDNLRSTGFSQLLLSLSSEAVHADHEAHAYLAEHYERFRETVRRALTGLQARGEFPAEADVEAASALIVSVTDGLQLQWFYDPTVDVRGALMELLARLGVPVPDDLRGEGAGEA